MNSVYVMPLSAKRILLMCLSDLNMADSRDAHDGVFKISAARYRTYFGCDAAKASRDVRAGLAALYEGTVRFSPSDDSEWEEIEMRWLEMVKSNGKGKPTAEHEVIFTASVMPYLKELERGFARFNMKECGKLTSTNQIRLYEDLCLRRDSGWWNTTLDDFAARYDFTDSVIGRPSWVKRGFLDSALKQINKHTPLRVAVTIEGSSFKFTIIDTLKDSKPETE